MTPFPGRGLYAITPAGDGDDRRFVERVAAAVEGGAAAVQYRDKEADAATRLARAAALLDVCRAGGVPLVVNDDLDLAARIGADGVHVGRDDADAAHARRVLGDGAIVGVSCYDSLERARAACAAGATYVAFGSFYPSSIKPGAVRATPALLREAAAVVERPIVAIGGITVDNAGVLVEAGAGVLAVITGVFGEPDPRAAARALAALARAA